LTDNYDQLLIQSGLTDPRALTLDYDNDRLYWIDNLADSICAVQSSNLDGSDVISYSPNIQNCETFGLEFSVVSAAFKECLR